MQEMIDAINAMISEKYKEIRKSKNVYKEIKNLSRDGSRYYMDQKLLAYIQERMMQMFEEETYITIPGEEEKPKIFYECDTRDSNCEKHNCGYCRHTSDINHAKNFYKRRNGSFWENKPQTLNDVRREHGLKPIPDGDDYLFQEVGMECLPIAQVTEGERILKIAKEDEDLP